MRLFCNLYIFWVVYESTWVDVGGIVRSTKYPSCIGDRQASTYGIGIT
jgi:hypothetical protein